MMLGLGWDKYETRWSSKADERIGSVAHLKGLLVDEILPEEVALERLKQLPTEAAPTHHKAVAMRTLGSSDADALEIQSRALFSTEELKAKAEAARVRRVEAGIADDVESMQLLQPPTFDQSLVGKQLEVRWKYHNKDTGEPVFIWSSGRVTRVADGFTDKRSARAKKILPAGALLWAWDADADFGEQAGEQWLILLPDKWNRQVHYGWRYDPAQLRIDAAARASDATEQQGARWRRPERQQTTADGCETDGDE